MRRLLILVSRVVMVLLLVVAAVFAWGRLRVPNEVQATAMRLLRAPLEPVTGRNAWAAFWLIDYAVPENRIDTVYAQDRARMPDWLRQQSRDRGPKQAGFVSSAATTYAGLPAVTAADAALLCTDSDAACLPKVRAEKASLRAALERNRQRLQRYRAIDGSAYLWNDMPVSPATPAPSFQLLQQLRLSAAALRFVDGQDMQALTEVCVSARTLRRLHAHTNSLIGSMNTARWMDASERLFSEMLATLPLGQALPASCATAFAAVTPADVDMCAVAQRLFRKAIRAGKIMPSDRRRASRWLELDEHKGIGYIVAASYAWPCEDSERAAMFGDLRADIMRMPPLDYDFVDRVSNMLGVALARVAVPDLTRYMNYEEDYAAGLRLTALLLHAHTQTHTSADWSDYLHEGLDRLNKVGERSFQLDPDGRHMRMSFYGAYPNQGSLVLTLPGISSQSY